MTLPAVPSAPARLLHRLTHPPRAPLVQLTVYYLLLAAFGSLMAWQFPVVHAAIAGLPAAGGADAGTLRELLAASGPGRPPFLAFDLNMAVVMTGTLMVTIPLSWGYMSVREHVGYEQSVVQTLVVLPVVVAGIMMIVQFSLALAFALGGVAAAVRFRNTLKDVADAVYVFLAIGVGIAAGTGALSAALIMSAFFSLVAVLLWRCNFGECEMSRRAVESARSAAARKAARGAARTASRKGPRAPGDVASRRRGELTVHVADASAREQVEALLEQRTRRWRLQHRQAGDAGRKLLRYELRLKRSTPLAAVAVAVQEELGVGAGDVAVLTREREAA